MGWRKWCSTHILGRELLRRAEGRYRNLFVGKQLIILWGEKSKEGRG